MKHAYIIYIALSLVSVSMYGQDSSDDQLKAASDQIAQAGEEIYSGASSFLGGMAQSFGYVPSSYTYSFRAFNDTPAPIVVGIQQETNVMGGTFAGDLKDYVQVGSFQDTGDYFQDKKLYLRVWLLRNASDISSYANASTIGAEAGLGIGAVPGGISVTEMARKDSFFDKKITSLTQENDPYTYYYHAFTSGGVTKGEYLGIKDVTSEFAGVFYNSLPEADGNEVEFDFVKSGSTYTVTLEPSSFNLLESDTSVVNSIRPPSYDESRDFVFKQGSRTLATIAIAPEGIANVQTNPETNELEIVGPMTYTYNVWADSSGTAQIGMQGLNVGNFDQPMGRVRDINPLQGKLWYMSAEQSQQATNSDGSTDYSSIPYDIQEALWISYVTNDQVIQQKLEPGSVIDLNMIRPQIAEDSATMFVVLIKSIDDTKSKTFLNRLHQDLIGSDSLYTQIADPTNVSSITADITANENGIVVDNQAEGSTGLTGYVVLTDTFYPRGLGSGPYYYSIPSGQLQIGSLANLLYFSDGSYDSSGSLSSEFMQDFSQNVVQWIKEYSSGPDQVESSVISYMQANGADGIFDESGALTISGEAMIQNFLTGAISISNPPVIRQAGTNWYPLTMGSVPSGWPA